MRNYLAIIYLTHKCVCGYLWLSRDRAAILIWGVLAVFVGFGVVSGPAIAPNVHVRLLGRSSLKGIDVRIVEHTHLRSVAGANTIFIEDAADHIKRLQLPLNGLEIGRRENLEIMGFRSRISTLWEQRSFFSVSRRIVGMARRPLGRGNIRETFSYNLGMQGGAVASVDYGHLYFQLYVLRVWQSVEIAWAEEIRVGDVAYPGAGLEFKKICASLGSVRSFLIGAIHFDGIEGVNRKQDNASYFHVGLCLVPPVLFWVMSNLAMCLGWLKLRLWCNCQRDWYIGMAGVFIGFPLSVWSLSILTDALSQFR